MNHEAIHVREAVGLDIELIGAFIRDFMTVGNSVIDRMKYLYEKYGQEKLHLIASYIVISKIDDMIDDHALKHYFFLLIEPDFSKHERLSYLIEALCRYFDRVKSKVNFVQYCHILFFFISTAFFIGKDGKMIDEYYEAMKNVEN
ncbi:MAG: hypothetical protein QXT86_10365 [Archaeoglobaceae archaeon]